MARKRLGNPQPNEIISEDLSVLEHDAEVSVYRGRRSSVLRIHHSFARFVVRTAHFFLSARAHDAQVLLLVALLLLFVHHGRGR